MENITTVLTMKDIMASLSIFLYFIALIGIPLIIACLITKPIAKRAYKKRIENEAREEYYKMKLIEKMKEEDEAKNRAYRE